MTSKGRKWFIALLKRNPFPRTFNKIMAKVAPPIDRLVMRMTGGRHSVLNPISGLPTVMVTCIGRKSGKPRTIPLLFIRDPQQPERFALVASNFGQKNYPAWYYNLSANPRATCNIRGEERAYIAEEIAGELYDYFWQLAVETYFGYEEYKRAASHRHIPIFLMTPVA